MRTMLLTGLLLLALVAPLPAAAAADNAVTITLRYAGGAPVQDRWVYLYSAKQDANGGYVRDRQLGYTNTGDTGIARFRDLQDGVYLLSAEVADGYAWDQEVKPIRLSGGMTHAVELNLARFTLALRWGDGSVMPDRWVYVYTVKRDANGQDVRDRQVRYHNTGNTGKVSFDLMPGRYMVESSAEGYPWTDLPRPFSLAPGQIHDAAASLGRLSVVLRGSGGELLRDHWVYVYTQKQDANGNSVRDQQVRYHSTGSTGQTDFDLTAGRYLITYSTGSGRNLEVKDVPVTGCKITRYDDRGVTAPADPPSPCPASAGGPALAPAQASAAPSGTSGTPEVGELFGLRKGTDIRTGPGFSYPKTIPEEWGGAVPEDNWTVLVTDGPRCEDNWLWWDVSRKAVDPGGGTGWATVVPQTCEPAPSPAGQTPSSGSAQAAPTLVGGGALERKWQALGGEGGFLGPVTVREQEAQPSPLGTTGVYAAFRGGHLHWSPRHGTYETHGGIDGLHIELGGSGGWLGFPTTDERDWNGKRRSDFEGGFVTWDPAQGAVAYRRYVVFIRGCCATSIDNTALDAIQNAIGDGHRADWMGERRFLTYSYNQDFNWLSAEYADWLAGDVPDIATAGALPWRAAEDAERLAQQIEDRRAATAERGERPVYTLIGHSHGGHVALAYAGRGVISPIPQEPHLDAVVALDSPIYEDYRSADAGQELAAKYPGVPFFTFGATLPGSLGDLAVAPWSSSRVAGEDVPLLWPADHGGIHDHPPLVFIIRQIVAGMAE